MRRLNDLRVRFDDFVLYARDVGRHSPFSLQWYRTAFQNYRAFLEEALNVPETEFRTREVSLDAWCAWNARRGVRPITMNGYWRALRAFFLDRERRDGFVNPFRGTRPPAMGTTTPKALSAQECSRILLTAANYPWKTAYERALASGVIGIMLFAGLRRSEVLHLTLNDVNVEDGTIRVVRGKGRFGGKDRTAYIPPDLSILLRDFLRERQRTGRLAPEFFLSARHGGPIGPMGLRVLVKKISEAAQIHFSAHILRHSFVSHLLRNGVPLHIARDLAGHASIETTLGYLKVFDEDRAANVRKIRFR